MLKTAKAITALLLVALPACSVGPSPNQETQTWSHKPWHVSPMGTSARIQGWQNLADAFKSTNSSEIPVMIAILPWDLAQQIKVGMSMNEWMKRCRDSGSPDHQAYRGQIIFHTIRGSHYFEVAARLNEKNVIVDISAFEPDPHGWEYSAGREAL